MKWLEKSHVTSRTSGKNSLMVECSITNNNVMSVYDKNHTLPGGLPLNYEHILTVV